MNKIVSYQVRSVPLQLAKYKYVKRYCQRKAHRVTGAYQLLG